jgi:DNA-binding NtrC family response regulator
MLISFLLASARSISFSEPESGDTGEETMGDPVPSPTLILVVDDDEAICRTLSVALQVKGYDVMCAFNPRMAEQLIDVRRPDLILTDIVMDEADGLELINQLMRTRQLAVPIIAMSGVPSPHGFDRLEIAERLGAVATLAKPFSTAVLYETIERALAQSRAPKS